MALKERSVIPPLIADTSWHHILPFSNKNENAAYR